MGEVSGNGGAMCVRNGKADPTSIYVDLAGQRQKTGCFAWEMKACEFDIKMQDCDNTWAAPLWLRPHPWSGLCPGTTDNNGCSGLSGEVDLAESCPIGEMVANFAACNGADKDTPKCSEVAWKDTNMHCMRTRKYTMTINSAGDLTTKVCHGSVCNDAGFFLGYLASVNPTREKE